MTTTEQPVRFYKFIALTFLFVTIILLSVIMFMSSKRATIIIESKATPVDINDSLLIGSGEWAGSLQGELGTIEVELEKEFYPTATEQKEAQARGTVTLYNDSGTSQPLVATTRLLTSDGILFRLENRVTVPAGGNIEAEVYSDEEGAEGNIEASEFTIPGLSAVRQKEIYAKSTEAMTGGIREIGILGVEDMNKAKEQMLSDLQTEAENKLKQENPGAEATFLLLDESYESDAEIGDEVSEFNLTGKATILAVFYDGEDLQNMAEKLLSRRAVEDIEVIQPGQDKPTLVIEDYDLEKGTATVNLFYSGFSSLDSESKQLEKSMFFGKTKDEVRRYLLKLDHVRSVDVKFSPRWIRTVPYIGEHVDIIIKEVE